MPTTKKTKKKKEEKRLWRNIEKTAENFKFIYNTAEFLVVFDTETTGLKTDKDRIIQISAIKINKDFNEIDRFNMYANPYPVLVSPKITSITGITADMVENAKPESEVMKLFDEFTKDCNFIAYNSEFDYEMLTAAFKRAGIERKIEHFDVREVSYDMVPNCSDFKLLTVCEYLELVNDDNFHDAMFDVEMTLKIIKKYYLTYLNFCNTEISKSKAKVFGLNPWSIGKNHRIYVPTSVGSFYYDVIKKHWGEKDASFDDVNMIDVEKQANDLATRKGYASLAKVKESVFYRDL